jgi:mono/diheme cytochrome c family protein
MMRLLAIALVVLAVAGCDEMDQQPRYDHYEKSTLFPDGKSLQSPPAGTIARDEPDPASALRDRPAMSPALMERGRERYGIYCTPCHGAMGDGRGIVPSRGFPQPPSFHIQRLRSAPSSHFVEIITKGHGVMYSYADRVTPADRWAIAAYIRALQLSQAMPVAALSEEDKRKLEGGPQ